MDNNNIEYLFKLVFNNIVLFRKIYGFIEDDLKLKNKKIKFTSRNELIQYKEINYVESIEYTGKEKLKKGDLPNNGILKKVKDRTYESIYLLNIEGILPSSITKLKIGGYPFPHQSKGYEEFNFIPTNLKELTIIDSKNIIPNSNLFKCTTVEKLYIKFCYYEPKSTLSLNSLPISSITELSIGYINGSFDIRSIPLSVSKLQLSISMNEKEFEDNITDSLPNNIQLLCMDYIITTGKLFPKSSLKILELFPKGALPERENNINKLKQLIPLLPSSIERIITFKSFEEFNLEFPSTITVNYLNRQSSYFHKRINKSK